MRTEKQKHNDSKMRTKKVQTKQTSVRDVYDSFAGFPFCQKWIASNQEAFKA